MNRVDRKKAKSRKKIARRETFKSNLYIGKHLFINKIKGGIFLFKIESLEPLANPI